MSLIKGFPNSKYTSEHTQGCTQILRDHLAIKYRHEIVKPHQFPRSCWLQVSPLDVTMLQKLP
jgi:hypothetical protein